MLLDKKWDCSKMFAKNLQFFKYKKCYYDVVKNKEIPKEIIYCTELKNVQFFSSLYMQIVSFL